MKKFLVFFCWACFIFSGPKTSGQDSNVYKHYDLQNYNMVGAIMSLKEKFLEIQKKYTALKIDSLEFTPNLSPFPHNCGVIFDCDGYLVQYEIVWNKNKLDKALLPYSAVAYDRMDQFLVRYQSHDSNGRETVVIFYHDKNGNGGFFKEDPDGPFIIDVYWYNSGSHHFSTMNKREVLEFRKRMVDLFAAVNPIADPPAAGKTSEKAEDDE